MPQTTSKNLRSLICISLTLVALSGCDSTVPEENGSANTQAVSQERASYTQEFPAVPKSTLAALKKDCPLNVFYQDEQNNVILNGKNLGQGYPIGLFGDKPLYVSYNKEGKASDMDTKGYDIGHIMFGDKDYGHGFSVNSDGENVVFTRMIDGKEHVFYNGVDSGEGPYPVTEAGHLAYSKNNHVIYDGKDMGEGSFIILKGGNIVFLDPEENVIFNGKNLGKIFGSGSLNLAENGVYFEQQGGKSVWYDGKNAKIIDGIIRGVDNGKVLSETGQSVLVDNLFFGLGVNAHFSEGHILYENHGPHETEFRTYVDGKDMGVLGQIMVDQDHIAYAKGDDGDIIFDNLDIGQGEIIDLQKDNIFYKQGDRFFCNAKSFSPAPVFGKGGYHLFISEKDTK